MDNHKYATLRDLSEALEKLEEKVPSRWEMRALILGAIIVQNANVPDEVTTTAIAVGVVGLVGKALSVVFLRN